MLSIKNYFTSLVGTIAILLPCVGFGDAPLLPGGSNGLASSMQSSAPNLDQFENWTKSRFAIFFVDKKFDFSAYDKVLFFPTVYEKIIFSKKSNRQLEASWEKELLDQIKNSSLDLDKMLSKKFKSSKVFTLTDKREGNVLLVEFRMKEFFPHSKNAGSATGTRGLVRDLGGLGALTYEAVVVDSETGKLVAVIQDRILISSSNMTSNIKINQNVAWSHSIKDIAEKLYKDFEKRKKISNK